MTGTLALLLTISSWCGNPGYYHLSSYDVNQCRKNIINCINNYKGPLVISKVEKQCIENEKLP